MYRLYVDEVGTDDVRSVTEDHERYLSLTGVAMQVNEARDVLSPRVASLKAEVFDHDPDEPVILHRKKIVKCNAPFSCLREQAKRDQFDELILAAMTACNYRVITALIDKKAMLSKAAWTNKEPDVTPSFPPAGLRAEPFCCA